MPDLAVQHLLRDHREGEKAVALIEELLAAQAGNPQWDAARRELFAQIVHFFEDVVIDHVQKEEQVLFPALESFLPREMGPLAVLRGEHREICAHFRRLCELGGMLSLGKVDAPLRQEFERVARATVQLTRDHIYKEDRVLFPMIARFLTPERDAFLLHEMEALDAAGKGAAKQTLC